VNVLVIPEDFRKDQYILKPIVSAMLGNVPRGSSARVVVCQDPLLGGIAQAMSWDRLVEVFEMYPMVDLFLLLVDRDGELHRRRSLDHLEARAAVYLGDDRRFLAEHAWQELEVWALAGHDLPWPWQEVRAERNPKEVYFLPYAQQRGLLDEPGQGRKTLAVEAAAKYRRVRSRCKEDLEALEVRLSPPGKRRKQPRNR
jgi:hypothetical protein